MFMIFVYAAVSKFAYAAIKIKMRHLRLNQVDPAGILASYGYLSPLYFLLAIALYWMAPQELSFHYATLVLATAFLNWVSCFGSAWLLDRFPPGRLDLAHKAGIVAFAALWDVMISDWRPSGTQIFVLGIAFCSAISLQFLQQSHDKTQAPKTKEVVRAIAIMLGLAVVTSTQWGTFQLAIKTLGEGVYVSLFHMGVHGTITLGLFWVIGRRRLNQDCMAGAFSKKDFCLIIALLFVAATAEAIVLGALPLTIVSLLALSGIGLLWCHDVYMKHEKFSFLKLTLVLTAFGSLGWMILNA